MAIVPMTKLIIYSHKSCRGALLKYIQRQGVVQIKQPEENDTELKCENVSSEIAFFDRSINSVKEAIETVSVYDDTKKPLFASKRLITDEDYNTVKEANDELLRLASEINSVKKSIASDTAAIARLRGMIEGYELWKSFEPPLSYSGTRNTYAFIGTIPNLIDFDEFAAAAEAEFSEIYIEKINSGIERIGIFVVCERTARFKVEDFVRKYGFSKPSFTLSENTAAAEIVNLEKEIALLQTKIKNSEKDLNQFAAEKSRLELFYDYLLIRKERYETRQMLLQTKSSVILQGYIPAEKAEGLKEEIEKSFDCYMEIITPDETEQLPVLFENNAFVTPVEPVVEMFSMPSRDDIDPNPVMSVFYYLFFGLMLSDAGYGLLLLLGGWFISKKYKPDGTMGKMIKLFTVGGAFTMFWGALFGSWFGDLIPKIAETFFNTKIGAMGIYDPIADPMPLLILSMILGVIHLFAGMGLNFYNLARHGKWKEAIFDVGFWYLLLIGLIMLIGGGMIMKTGTAIAIIGALGLILTQGRDKPNIFMRIFGGVGSLYDITSYLSDLLSYSRLLALGLATGVISMVVNTMAALGGKSVLGVILFIVVCLIGHTMNILINTLGAFVHTNRLQYVEFFKKFYEGGGIPFKPFGINTKYAKFKEE